MVEGIIDKATSAIVAADLTPIEHRILVDFIEQSNEPSLAAQEVLGRICDDGRPVEETLRMLKKEWYELVAVGEYLDSLSQMQASTKYLIVSRSTPVDAPLRDLVDRRDRSRCCVTPPDRQQLDAPVPTFIIPPVASERRDVDRAEVSSLFLQTITLITNTL
jgi:hypothetical protein